MAVATAPATSPSGWGLGFYQNGEVLHKKRPLRPEERIDWEDLADGVRSDCVILHLRQPTVGDFRSENIHPFRMRSWTLAHLGTIEEFEAIRGRFIEAIPDFIRRNIRGSTDSEIFFHVLLSFLHDGGKLDAVDVQPADVLPALRSAVALTDRLEAEVGASAPVLNVIVSNGRQMMGVCRGAPMAFIERTGLPEVPDEPESRPGGVDPRYVLIVSDGDTLPTGYTRLADGDVVFVDRDLSVSLHTL